MDFGEVKLGLATEKIREYEWFEIETKIRKFVNELLEPATKKFSEDKKKILLLQDEITTYGIKLEQLNNMFIQRGKNIPIFETYDKNFLELDQYRAQTQKVLTDL